MRVKVLKPFSFGDNEYKKDHLYDINTEESEQAKTCVDDWVVKALVEVIEEEAAADELVIHDEQTDEPVVGMATKEAISEIVKAVVAETKPVSSAPVIPNVEVGEPSILKDENWGFKSFSEFHLATYRAAHPGIRKTDKRLEQIKQVTPGFPPVANATQTGDAASAGNLLAPGFLREVQNYIYKEDTLFGQARVMNIVTNDIEIPFDETRPWDGGTGGGVVATWTGEGAKIDQSKPIFGRFTLKPKKLAALVPVTEEMLSDDAATNLDSYIGRLVGEALSFAIDDAIVQGAGSTAVPAGILGSGATISDGTGGLTNLTSTPTPALVKQNVLEMYSRQVNPSTATWWTTHDIFPILQEMTIGDMPVWVPPVTGGLSVTPYGTILGRPLYLNKALGAIDSTASSTFKGQINFWDMSQYMMATRGGVQSAMSIHLWFDYQTTAFRYTVRVDGKTWATKPVPSPTASTPVGGTNAITSKAHKTTSCFLSSYITNGA